MPKILRICEDDYENIFVISDIHAHGNLFEKLLDEINYTRKDLIIILGDSCDRGDEIRKTYELLFDLKDKVSLIHLKGNHEEMLYDYFVYNKIFPYVYECNGGPKSIEFFRNNEELLEEILDYIEDMPDIVESENNIFVHAGLNLNLSLEEQSEDYIRWARSDFYLGNNLKKKTIIFGHTIQPNGEIRHYKYYNVIGIDCGTYRYNRIGCYEVKSKKIFYVKDE